MKKPLITCILVLLLHTVYAQNRDAILGKWESEHGSGQLQIYKTDDSYSGKIIWLKEPDDATGRPKLDIYNPVAKLRSQPIIGLEILKNFEYKGGGIWDNGTVYNPKSGKSYSCKMTLVNNNKLNIRGYIGVSLMGKTEKWTRIP